MGKEVRDRYWHELLYGFLTAVITLHNSVAPYNGPALKVPQSHTLFIPVPVACLNWVQSNVLLVY